MNLREKILASKDLKTKLVEIPEWDSSVYAYELTAGEREQVFEELDGLSPHDSIVLAVIAGARDDKGEHIFTKDDLAALKGKSFPVIERIYGEIMRLSGVDLKATEDEPTQVEKTSADTLSSGTITE